MPNQKSDIPAVSIELAITKFHAMYDTAPRPVYLLASDASRIITYNSMAEKLLQFHTQVDFLKLSLWEICTVAKDFSIHAMKMEVMAKGRTLLETKHEMVEGMFVPLSVTVSLFQGNEEQFFVAAVDMQR